jgi:hypothetical protein
MKQPLFILPKTENLLFLSFFARYNYDLKWLERNST